MTLIRALDVALELIEQETLPGVFERHAILGRAAREAVKAMGLELFGPEDEHANVVTVARTPEGIDGAAIPKTMRDKLRHHDRGRPGTPEGQDRAHRALRLLRGVRRPDHDRRARDGPGRARRTT